MTSAFSHWMSGNEGSGRREEEGVKGGRMEEEYEEIQM